jgi:hypothetical protein
VKFVSRVYYLSRELDGSLVAGPISIYLRLESGVTIICERCINHGSVRLPCSEDLKLFISQHRSGVLVGSGMKGVRVDVAA